jgi:diguanylate cyclase (GGDEF)-like protein
MLSDPTATSSVNILVVDDTPENIHLLSEILLEEGYSVRKALNGTMALKAIQAAPPDLVLLDVMMPDMSGYDVCQQLKMNPRHAQIPVIFVSALDQAFDKVKAFDVGGVDYVTKPFQIQEVLARIQNQLALRSAQDQIQQLNAYLEDRVRERTLQLEQVVEELQSEVEQRRQVQDRLKHMALHDTLTGLPNRALLMDQLEQSLQHRNHDSSYGFAVLFLDCDRFKVINDSLGHLMGDELLKHIAHRIQHTISVPHLMARLGGDEFAILLPDMDDIEAVTQVAHSILQSFIHSFQVQDHEIFINASIGIALSQDYYTQPEQLLRDADMAMYRAKTLGRARYHIFDAAMHDEALHLLTLETDLRKAIEQEQLYLCYQPIWSLATRRIVSFEALLRWVHPDCGFVSPLEFIPIAEETGMITKIGHWVLQQACAQLRQWQSQQVLDESVSISVNLSVRQLAAPNFLQQVDAILADTGLQPHQLKLEITESVLADNQNAIAVLRQLRDRQVQLSLDDFGTGFSSLSYLNTLPFNILKIDKSFVQPVTEEPESLGLIPAILSIAKTLNMQVIAEGIETEQQVEQLQQLNCQLGQGYFFAKPLNAEQVVPFLTQQAATISKMPKS